MINLEVFFKNHFDNKNISDNNLRLFAEVHLQRIAANNPGGIYTTRITATTTAYTNYFGAISSEDVKEAVQQGLTITMNNAMTGFVDKVQQKEGIVRGTWGKESEEYQEFFPHGLDEYDQISLATAGLLMNRMVAASTAHVADLGAPFVTLFTDLRTTFQDARTAQLATMGEVEGLKSTAANTRDALEIELMKNLLITASNNVGDITMMPDYFDQSIIRRSGVADEGEGVVFTGPVAEATNEYINTDEVENATEETEAKFENPGTKPLRYYFAHAQGDAPGPATIFVDVAPGSSDTKTLGEMGWNPDTNSLLHVQVVGSGEGEYKVTAMV